MDSTGEPLATLSRDEGYVQASFTRSFAHPASEVWSALTDRAVLPQWLAAGAIEQRLGGRAHLDFADSGIVIDAVVTAFEPGRLLEYSWSSGDQPLRPLRWSLEPTAGGCQLTLRVRVPRSEDAARAAAGWEAHLEMLAAQLEGVPIRFPFDLFKAAREVYGERLPA